MSFEEGEKKLIELHKKLQREFGYVSRVLIFETVVFDENAKDAVQKKYIEDVNKVLREARTESFE